MFRRRSDPPLTREEFSGLMLFLMQIDAKLDSILEEMGIDDGED